MATRRIALKEFALGIMGVLLTFTSTTRPFLRAFRVQDPESNRDLGMDGSVRTTGNASSWWLLAPVEQGGQLHGGWTIHSLSAIEKGAAVMTLIQKNGSEARVHVCAKGESPMGIVQSHHLDFVLMDGGDGAQPTEESVGLALMQLADHLDYHEVIHPISYDFVSLLPHMERLQRYPDEGLV